MIDPSIWEDEDFGKLTMAGKLLFIGLFSNADDEGRLRGNPAYLKSTIFMYDDTDLTTISDLLKQVTGIMKSVRFYEVEGKQYIQLLKWNEYQKQHKDRVQSSTLPPYIEHVTDNVGQVTDNDGVSKLSKDKLSKDKLSNIHDVPSDSQEVKSLVVKKEYGKPSINRALDLLSNLELPRLDEEKHRWCIQRLFNAHGEEKTLKVMELSLSLRSTQFAPVISNYYQLEKKWGDIEAYIQRQIKDTGGVYDATAIS